MKFICILCLHIKTLYMYIKINRGFPHSLHNNAGGGGDSHLLPGTSCGTAPSQGGNWRMESNIAFPRGHRNRQCDGVLLGGTVL